MFSFLDRLIGRLGRDRPFTRREQLSLVFVSHLGILVGALLIVWKFDLSSGQPVAFLIGETAIILLAAPFTFTISVPGLKNLGRLASGGPPTLQAHPTDEKAAKEAAQKEGVESLAGFVLIVASVIQFAALASLLWVTGGPIGSPFAEMTLIIAVSTPFIANKPKTIMIVVAASVIYYALLILIYTDMHPRPETIRELKGALETDPSAWAYFAVNVMILLGGITFTILESLLRSAETRAAMGSAGNGGVAGGEVLPSTILPQNIVDGQTATGDGNGGTASDREEEQGENPQPAEG